MQIIQTAELTPEALAKLDFDTQYGIYNGLDSLMTSDLAQKLRPAEGTPEEHMYYFERALLPVALAMSKKGVLVDAEYKRTALEKLTTQADALNDLANKVAKVIWGKDVNIRSSVQLKKIFFEVLDIPKQFKRVKGETKVSTDYNALERIARDYVRGRFFAKIVLKIRDVEKLKGALETKLTPEHRWHSSFNIAGTETTRFSSSPDAFGYGANQQNITEELRRIFIPDPGKILAYTDLKGAESMFVAYETSDENYIKAADSGDSHTLIASKLFGIPAVKDEAEKVYSHGRSYRDISKASQHACVSENHEIWTEKGWVPVGEYDGVSPIAVYDPSTGREFMQKPINWNVHYYIGRLFQIDGPLHKQEVTPNHKLIIPLGKENHVVFAAEELATLPANPLYPYYSTLFYSGKVYCPTVSTGFWITKCQDVVSVTGNSNYGGTPFAIAMQKNVPVRLVEEFQKGYFKEYPGIRDWQNYIIEQLQTTGTVMTSTGVKRTFWGRLRDDDTIKQALAFRPQAGIAHVMNMGMVRVHYGVPEVDLLMQVHDAVVFQMDEDRVDELMPKVIKLLEVPLDITDIKGVTRRMKIPVEANIGYNWSKFDPKKKLFEDGNPLGMREWKPGLAKELKEMKYGA